MLSPWERCDEYRWDVVSSHVVLWHPLTGPPVDFWERLVEIDGGVRTLAEWRERLSIHLSEGLNEHH